MNDFIRLIQNSSIWCALLVGDVPKIFYYSFKLFFGWMYDGDGRTF